MGVLREHTHVVECIAFSPTNVVPLTPEAEKNKKKAQPHGAFIASGSRDKTVRVWETSTQQCIFMLVSHYFPFHPSYLTLGHPYPLGGPR